MSKANPSPEEGDPPAVKRLWLFASRAELKRREGRAVSEDEDERTFARFSHWASAGFYRAADFSSSVRGG